MGQSSLNLLTPREAIVDALSRALVACDNHDAELFNSAWAGEDASFTIVTGDEKKTVPNLALLRTHVLDKVGPMDTTHSISNIRVDVKDDPDTAFLTATSMAQHCPPGRGKEPDGPKYMVSGVYSAEIIKMDGTWKMKKASLKVVWTQGDPSVMEGGK